MNHWLVKWSWTNRAVFAKLPFKTLKLYYIKINKLNIMDSIRHIWITRQVPFWVVWCHMVFTIVIKSTSFDYKSCKVNWVNCKLLLIGSDLLMCVKFQFQTSKTRKPTSNAVWPSLMNKPKSPEGSKKPPQGRRKGK